MNDSTKRAIRTFVQAVLGIAAAVAVALPLFPPSTGRTAGIIAGTGVVAATVAKIWNALDERAMLPDWLTASSAPVPDEEAYRQAWHAGHTAATVAAAGTDRGAEDVTMIRPLVPDEQGRRPAVILDSRRRALDDEPGKHSPDRGGRVPTTERARPTGAWSAAAPAPGRRRLEGWPVYPELDPAAVVREIDNRPARPAPRTAEQYEQRADGSPFEPGRAAPHVPMDQTAVDFFTGPAMPGDYRPG
jgi:hypothetical protein